MNVKAKEGTKCPKEGKPREYITDDVAQEVPDTPYYRRLVADGSLIENKLATPPSRESPSPVLSLGSGQDEGAAPSEPRTSHSKRGGRS